MFFEHTLGYSDKKRELLTGEFMARYTDYIKIFLMSELLIFGYCYVYGTYGLYAIKNVTSQSITLRQKISVVTAKIKGIEHQCNQWQEYSFYQERIARQRLNMARKGDEVYYVNE